MNSPTVHAPHQTVWTKVQSNNTSIQKTQEGSCLGLCVCPSQASRNFISVIISKVTPRELLERGTLRVVKCQKEKVVLSSVTVTTNPREGWRKTNELKVVEEFVTGLLAFSLAVQLTGKTWGHGHFNSTKFLHTIHLYKCTMYGFKISFPSKIMVNLNLHGH